MGYSFTRLNQWFTDSFFSLIFLCQLGGISEEPIAVVLDFILFDSIPVLIRIFTNHKMNPIFNQKGKRNVVHPQRLNYLQTPNTVYSISCEVSNFGCLTHEHGCGRGFFSLFIQAVNGIYFEQHTNLLWHVNFGNTAYFYSDAGFESQNFWNYYFLQKEPSADSTLIINEAFEVYPIRIWEKSFIEKIHHKVITKLQWREDVWQFVLKNTAEIRNHAVLGIHIRKTDHSNELKPSPLEDYFTQIDRLLPSYTKLFVATDYKDVLETMRQKYLDKIIFHVAHRSRGTVAVHTMHNLLDRYQLGLEALLDCYSLSLCKKTIRSHSNLSYEACLFNPTMPYILIESREAWWKRWKTLLVFYLDKWNIRKW